MKQPREDITGTRRDDYLLSLDERALPHRDALIYLAQHLKSTCLVGNPAPIVQRMYERITYPEPGDLVVEVSAGYSSDPDHRLKALGVLIEHREEWLTTDEQWEAEKAEDDSLADEDRLTDHAWYVQYGPEPVDVCRWVNCAFTALPIGRDGFSRPVGRRDGGSITFTRDDLLTGLADSGFELRPPR